MVVFVDDDKHGRKTRNNVDGDDVDDVGPTAVGGGGGGGGRASGS